MHRTFFKLIFHYKSPNIIAKIALSWISSVAPNELKTVDIVTRYVNPITEPHLSIFISLFFIDLFYYLFKLEGQFYVLPRTGPLKRMFIDRRFTLSYLNHLIIHYQFSKTVISSVIITIKQFHYSFSGQVRRLS